LEDTPRYALKVACRSESAIHQSRASFGDSKRLALEMGFRHIRAMDGSVLSQSPFAIVTFIVAPAMLTNASSVLAMSTINRMLRTRERMSELYAQSEAKDGPAENREYLLRQVNRVERQGLLLLKALRSIYVALGSFAAATLVTLIAAVLEQAHLASWYRPLTISGLLAGSVGVGTLIVGAMLLFHATRLSLASISEEAEAIRERQAARAKAQSQAREEIPLHP
jgi:hypothetical protein